MNFVGNIVIYSKKNTLFLFLTVLAVFWISPIAWMASTSLKSESEIFSPDLHWFPHQITFEHYFYALDGTPIARWFFNSIIISGGDVLFGLIIWSMAAFAFAGFRYRGKNILFIFVLSTMMIPPQATLIPNYLFMSSLGWVNTYQGVLVPALANAFGVFLLKQFFEGIPREFYEAAKIDGYGWFGIYWRIIIPLSKPALAALGIFTMINSWNNFLWPLIMLQDKEMMTLPIGLASMQATYATNSYGVLMAASFIASLPVLLAYLFFQRQIVQGIAISAGIKG